MVGGGCGERIGLFTKITFTHTNNYKPKIVVVSNTDQPTDTQN